MFGRVRWSDKHAGNGIIRGDDGNQYYFDISVIKFPYRSSDLRSGCRVSFVVNEKIDDCLCACEVEWVKDKNIEVSMDNICGLKTSQFEKIYSLYRKDVNVLPKTGGHKGWNIFCSAYDYESRERLSKITFEIVTTEMPSEADLDKALRNELIHRLEVASGDFTSSVFDYFKSQNRKYVEMFKSEIHEVIIENSKLFENILLENIEIPEVNVLYQRILDFNAYQAEQDLLVEAERKCRQQAQDRRMQQDLVPVKKKEKTKSSKKQNKQVLKEDEFGELKI